MIFKAMPLYNGHDAGVEFFYIKHPQYNVHTTIERTAMRQIWSLALACLTKLKILTKHERILISYKFFHIKVDINSERIFVHLQNALKV